MIANIIYTNWRRKTRRGKMNESFYLQNNLFFSISRLAFTFILFVEIIMMKARWSFSLPQMAYEAEEKKTKRQGSKKKYNFDHFRIEIKIKIMSGSKKNTRRAHYTWIYSSCVNDIARHGTTRGYGLLKAILGRKRLFSPISLMVIFILCESLEKKTFL